jgi:peroxiredoxin
VRTKLIICSLLFCVFGTHAQNRKLSIGDTLPNFAYQGQFSKDYNLKELKGSFVLVNFWATWNQESRAMQFDYVDIYARYKDRKFKKGRKFYILSVSIDDGIEVYTTAIKKDNLPWKTHLCDFQGWNSPIVKLCAVETIPANYLLDPNGIIIAKNIKRDALEEILKAR